MFKDCRNFIYKIVWYYSSNSSTPYVPERFTYFLNAINICEQFMKVINMLYK